jgi:RNA polymerase sigma factor for flagellar operon FliA
MQASPISSAISADALQETWRRFHAARSKIEKARLKDQLILAHLWLVKQIAERLVRKLPRSVQLDDLYQPGVIGLCKAVARFESERGVQFSTYATPVVFGAIHDSLRHEDWVPRLVRVRAKALEQASRELRASLGRAPTDDEVAAAMGLDEQEYNKVREDARRIDQVSLSAPVCGNGEMSSGPLVTLVPNLRAPNPEESAQHEDLKRFITQGLDSTERLLVVLYYYEEMSMKEIGATLGISESRVSQLHSSIIQRLKVRLAFTQNALEAPASQPRPRLATVFFKEDAP